MNEHERLNGKWIQTYCNEDGVDNPEYDEGLESVSEFNNGKFVVHSADGTKIFEGIYEIRPGTGISEIDWTDTDGKDIGKTFPAIYTLTDTTFIFCAANEDTARPASFEPKTGHTIRKFVRATVNAIHGV